MPQEIFSKYSVYLNSVLISVLYAWELELSRLLKHIGLQQKKLEDCIYPFRFVDTVYESPGTTVLPLATPRNVEPIPVEVDVIKVNVP